MIPLPAEVKEWLQSQFDWQATPQVTPLQKRAGVHAGNLKNDPYKIIKGNNWCLPLKSTNSDPWKNVLAMLVSGILFSEKKHPKTY